MTWKRQKSVQLNELWNMMILREVQLESKAQLELWKENLSISQ